MVRGVQSFSFDKDTIDLVKKAEEVARKEGKKFNLSGVLREPIKQALQKYVFEHGAGNPSSTLDDYTTNENFLVTPMMMSDQEAIKKYLLSIRKTGLWPVIGSQLQLWVNQYNQQEAMF